MLRALRWTRVGAFGLSACLAVACGESKPEIVASASASSSAGPKGMSNKLAKAVQAAQSAGAMSSATPGGAPPPSGIFGPGDADKLLAPTAPATITVIDDGAEPRLNLKRKAPTEAQKLPLHIAISNGGQSMLPPIELALVVGPEKAKVEEKGGDKDKKPAPKGAASAQASAAASAAPSPPDASLTAEGPRLYATIVEASVEGGGDRAPKQLADLIGKLRGASIAFTLTDGGLVDLRRAIPSGEAQLDIVLRAVEEALTSLYMPAPSKPIGEGGYFMVADRRVSFGVEVLRYRVFKVVKVNGDVASISLDQKQYAVAPKIDLPQASDQLSKVTLTEYRALGSGLLDVAPNLLFAKGSAMRLQTQAGFVAAGGGDKGQHAALGIQLQALMGDIPAGVNVEQGPPGGGDEPPGAP